jgi:tetratricopeptide (TPR) repeat protein
MKYLQFLRLEENVEVFLNTKTGEEVYIGRTSTPLDGTFMEAAEVIGKHFMTAGEPLLRGNAATEVREATEMLEKVIAAVPDWWNAHWFLGKGQLALGNHLPAYEAFRRAYEYENGVEAIPRELAGVCLELGKFDEAVTVAEEAVGLAPDNADLLGNLALAYLMAGRKKKARRTIDAARRISPKDSINETISLIILEIEEGRRKKPKSLADLTKPAKPKKRGLFGRWW